VKNEHGGKFLATNGKLEWSLIDIKVSLFSEMKCCGLQLASRMITMMCRNTHKKREFKTALIQCRHRSIMKSLDGKLNCKLWAFSSQKERASERKHLTHVRWHYLLSPLLASARM
jgi:hypothetical protein